MYFLYSLGGVTFNKCWITLSILNCYSPNFQGFILMKNALNNQVGMLGDMFLWLVANLKQGVIYFIKQACGNDILASVYPLLISTVFLKYPLELKKSFSENWKENSVSSYWNFFSVITEIFLQLVQIVYNWNFFSVLMDISKNQWRSTGG